VTEIVEPTIDIHLTSEDLQEAMARDVWSGLQDPEGKRLPPIWFYDDRGSELFDEITRLPEYYLYRAERRLLEAHAPEIAERSQANVLVELGAGTCEKSRIILDAMSAASTLETYIPLDVSDTTLLTAATAICEEYDGLAVHAVVGDFSHVDRIPTSGRRLIAFLGSTIGNLGPDQRKRFLFDLDCIMGRGEHLLLGADLVKDVSRLLAAYDDAAGVTAAFNKNVLHVLNRELGADFDPSQFEHVAVWNEEMSHIEMRLRSLIGQTVVIKQLGLEVQFAKGEELLTETSAKFTREGLEKELFAAGLIVDRMWEDSDGFLLTLASPYC
jgi:L-histidine N-alpha-methyltransferase